ncbi:MULTISPECIES: carbohydrate kinase family protein [unclassified Myxococcus]|uniref:carbohydrate kinase family protein n=1 Tax=unclassified Myxococcus TaxID=2648731 RepID=UPI00157B8984|nr:MULTISPECIES: carbohydrate kinase family protein [unclassified Myxococcus]NTX05882.1 carbohydrate kinase family protein [Myxococcus sp. CA040A]
MQAREGTMEVLVIGNNTVDIVFSTRDALVTDGKVQADGLRFFGGGQGANVAAMLGALGVRTRYFGVFGGGDFGRLARGSLVESGVVVEGSLTVADCPQHSAAIIVDTTHGTRSLVMHKDARLRMDGIPADAAPLEQCGLVYLDGHEPAFSRALAKRARAQGLPVLADAEVAEEARPLLPYLTSLVAPGKVLRELTGERELSAAARTLLAGGLRVVVGTLGAEGCEGWTAQGEHHRVAAERCEVVDTTGAGDAFHAGYIAAVQAGHGFGEALRFATKVAAVKCGVPGPRAGVDRLALLGVGLGTSGGASLSLL